MFRLQYSKLRQSQGPEGCLREQMWNIGEER